MMSNVSQLKGSYRSNKSLYRMIYKEKTRVPVASDIWLSAIKAVGVHGEPPSLLLSDFTISGNINVRCLVPGGVSLIHSRILSCRELQLHCQG